MPESLFKYQVEGAAWLALKKYALLADEMGLGKSAQAVRAADAINAKPILVLCPAIVRHNWSREFAKFSTRTLNTCVLLTGAQLRKVLSADVTICSYDLASTKEGWAALSAREWGVCFLDEAHYLKNRKSRRAKAVLGAIALRCQHVWALTGTPTPNHPGELWPLLRAFGVVAVDYWSFVRRYCRLRDTPFGTQIVGGQRIDELRKLIAPYVLRRRKEDVLMDLPTITHSDVFVEPTPPRLDQLETYFEAYSIARRTYHDRWQAQEKLMVHNFKLLGPGDAIKMMEGLAPSVKSARQYIGLQKVPKVIDLIKSELENNAYEKIVLFGVHVVVVEMLRDGLRDFGSTLIYGGTDANRREKYIRNFMRKPECRVLVGNIEAAGIGINLTAAHHVGIVEADWTPARNAQAIMRVHRIGQTKPVTVRWFSIANSIDERIHRVLRRKTKEFIELWDADRKQIEN